MNKLHSSALNWALIMQRDPSVSQQPRKKKYTSSLNLSQELGEKKVSKALSIPIVQ